METKGNGSTLLARLQAKAAQEGAANATQPNKSATASAQATSTLAKATLGHTQLGGSRPTTDVVIAPQMLKVDSPVKPKKTSDKQVLFNVNGRNFGSVLPSGKTFRFKSGWLLTDEADVIDFVRQNASIWGVKEEK